MFFYEALYSRKITKLWNSPFSQLIPTKHRSCYQYVPFITLNMQLERLGWNISRPLLDHSLPEANSEASRFGLTLRQTFLWPSPTKVTSHAASFSSSHKYFVPHTFTFAVLHLVTIIFILGFNSTKLRFKSFNFFFTSGIRRLVIFCPSFSPSLTRTCCCSNGSLTMWAGLSVRALTSETFRTESDCF